MAIGVTGIDPDEIGEELLKWAWVIPQSCMKYEQWIVINGYRKHKGKVFMLQSGDTFGVRHTPKQVMIYHNDTVYCSWDTHLDGPVWACLGLMGHDVTVKQGTYIYNTHILYLIGCLIVIVRLKSHWWFSAQTLRDALYIAQLWKTINAPRTCRNVLSLGSSIHSIWSC